LREMASTGCWVSTSTLRIADPVTWMRSRFFGDFAASSCALAAGEKTAANTAPIPAESRVYL